MDVVSMLLDLGANVHARSEVHVGVIFDKLANLSQCCIRNQFL